MARNTQADDNHCPSCWKAKERADHLCICSSEHCTQLFLNNVCKLENWMEAQDSTSLELAYWTIKYLQGRGGISFSEWAQLDGEIICSKDVYLTTSMQYNADTLQQGKHQS